jgi:protein-S-isoprenylcysteine O-methyltransferase Ste14
MYKKILPPTWLLNAILLAVALHLVIPVTTILPPYWNLLGLIPFALGIALNLSADRAFHRAHTSVNPFDKPSTLVTWGVFRISRNPMYLGFVLILTGVAVMLGALTSLLVIPPFTLWIDRAYISFEEQALSQKFSVKWLEYKQSTRRWL